MINHCLNSTFPPSEQKLQVMFANNPLGLIEDKL